ncbi:hypothetical protein C8J55DRAFT_430551, partial [Lentinula edodes]
ITNHLSPVDLDSFSRCCRSFRNHTIAYKGRVFNIKRAYHGIFDKSEDLVDFQNLQASLLRLLVSGSTALKFFTRVDYGGDMDSYCHLPQAITVGSWFLAHGLLYIPVGEQLNHFSADFSRVCEHYDDETTPVDIPIQEDIREYKLNNIAVVWDFVRELLSVQLMATRGSPLTTILSFHSTCVMNILTHNAAYCLFPKLTLERRATLPMTEVQAAAINKYSQRGFEIMSNVPTSWTCNPNSALTFL